MKTILIIASGFIGLPLAIRLLEEGFIVTISTTQSDKRTDLEKLGIIAIKFNSNEDDDYLQFINFSYDYIVYALPPSVCKKYTYNSVLQKITSLLAKCENIVFTSSISVYRNNGNLYIHFILASYSGSSAFNASKLSPCIILTAYLLRLS